MNTIKISDGELLDKYSILYIKVSKIDDPIKKHNVKKEFAYIDKKVNKFKRNRKYLKLLNKLIQINKKLWKIEDDIRDKEREKQFDANFISLARKVYITNDLRFKIKNEINKLNDFSFKEEKSYKKY
jgi:hypothetical protein